MKILFVGRHNQPNSDDEGAVAHALRELGHEVVCIQENRGRSIFKKSGDVVLFFKWFDLDTLKQLKIPKVFWFFDLVEYPDPLLSARCYARTTWMRDVIPLVDLGFCTDGDFVSRDRSGKLVWLMQGADERVVGEGSPFGQSFQNLLFMGIKKGGGSQRESFVDEVASRYGCNFSHVEKTYQRKLADVIAGSKIVLAPDSPVSNSYWSNRVFLSLGFSAFLLHPYCERLKEFYKDGEEIIYYHDRHDLFEKIDYYLDHPIDRQLIAQAGYQRTFKEHLYRHRCEKLIETVKERLGI